MLVALAVLASTLRAQIEAPDFELIEYNITNKSSNLYYPSLVERFKAADTTLTLEEVRHLYFGSALQPNRKVIASPYSAEISQMIADPSNKVDYNRMLVLADKAIAENFLDIDAYHYRFTACMHIYGPDNDAEARKSSFQYNCLVSAIMSSGDGLSASTAFHVVDVTHEYNVMLVLRINYDQQQLISENGRFYDVMILNYNTQNNRLFFDVTDCVDDFQSYINAVEKDKASQQPKWKRLFIKH